MALTGTESNVLLSVGFGALLLYALREGFKYGNPLPHRRTLEERLSPKARVWFSMVVSALILLGASYVFWLSLHLAPPPPDSPHVVTLVDQIITHIVQNAGSWIDKL